MKTLNNILTLALFASMTIACGASTQVSDSALENLTPAPVIASADAQDGTMKQINAEPQPAVKNVGQKKLTKMGAAAINDPKLPYCPEGFTGLASGCSSKIINRIPRPTIQHAQAAAFTAAFEMNQADSFGGQHMGGDGF